MRSFIQILMLAVCGVASADVMVYGVYDPEKQLNPAITSGQLLTRWTSAEKTLHVEDCWDWWHARDELLPRGSLQLDLKKGNHTHSVSVTEGQWRLVTGPVRDDIDGTLALSIREGQYDKQAAALSTLSTSLKHEMQACMHLEASAAFAQHEDYEMALKALARVKLKDPSARPWVNGLLKRTEAIYQMGARKYNLSLAAAESALETDQAARLEVTVALDLDLVARSKALEPEIPPEPEIARRAVDTLDRLAPGSVTHARMLLGLLHSYRAVEAFQSGEEVAHRSQKILAVRAPSSDWLHAAMIGRGVMFWFQGNLRESVAINRELLSMPRVSQYRTGQARNNLGLSLINLGFHAEAENVLQKQLRNLEATNQKLRAVFVLINLGISMNEQGDFELAAAYYEKALQFQEELEPGTMQTALILNNYGGNQRRLAKLDEAGDYLRRGKAIADKLQPGGTLAGALREGLSDIEQDSGNLDRALGYAHAALELHQKGEHGALRGARIGYRIGLLERLRGNLDEAEQLQMNSLSVRRRLQPDTGFVAQSLHQLSLIASAKGHESRARELACEAVDVLEIQRQRTGANAARGSRFNEVFGPIYQTCMVARTAAGQHEASFLVLEKSRAASLLSLLAERELLLDSDLPDELQARRKQYTHQYDSLQQQLTNLSPDQESEIDLVIKQLQEVEQSRASLISDLRGSNPRLANLEYPLPLTAQQVMNLIENDTVYLSYSVGETNTVLFVISPASEGGKRSIRSVILPLGTELITDKVRSLRELVSQPGSPIPEIQAAAAILFNDVMAPAQPELTGANRLLISADGPLLELPFAVLTSKVKNEYRYLVQQISIRHTLSATVYGQLKSRKTLARHAVVAFADPQHSLVAGDENTQRVAGQTPLSVLPRLPAAVREVEAISRHFGPGTKALVGTAATERQAKALGTGTSFIHFAVHGVLNRRLPLSSALVLGQDREEDGLLHAWEIFESMRIDADLVTLSACETGLGKTVSGEGMIGLVRAFQFAGAKNIIASLWRVSDRSTARLMDQLYGYLSAGMPKDEALRRSQLSLIQAQGVARAQDLRGIGGVTATTPTSSAHPFYWSAFRLQQ